MTISGPQPADTIQRYRALALGLLINFGIFGFLYFRGLIPILPPPAEYGFMGGAMAAASLAPLLVGFLVFKPKVPRRGAGQSLEAFVSNPEFIRRALLLWVLWEGGGIIGLVGFALTGQIYPAIAALFALAALFLHGRRHFSEQP